MKSTGSCNFCLYRTKTSNIKEEGVDAIIIGNKWFSFLIADYVCRIYTLMYSHTIQNASIYSEEEEIGEKKCRNCGKES